jgi:hypothetical protein
MTRLIGGSSRKTPGLADAGLADEQHRCALGERRDALAAASVATPAVAPPVVAMPAVATTLVATPVVATPVVAMSTAAPLMLAKKEVSTFHEWFTGRFWREWVVGRRNKPTEVKSKEYIYERHLKSPEEGVRRHAARRDRCGRGSCVACVARRERPARREADQQRPGGAIQSVATARRTR